MRLFKIMLIGITVSVLSVGQVYSAPKGNNGKGNNGNANNSSENSGNSQAVNTNRGNRNAASQTRGQSALHRQRARRLNENNRRREARNLSIQHNSDDERLNLRDMRNERVHRQLELLSALDRARWSHNPQDTRGQGNKGKEDMQDPFGHDKSSDRKEIFGNNGRIIRISEEIVLLESMVTFDWQTEHEYVQQYQIMVDYLNSLIASGSLNEEQTTRYTTYISGYESRIAYYQSLSYTSVFLRGDATIDYTLNLDLHGIKEESTLLISTSLVVSEPFTTYVRTYNEETGSWEYMAVHYETGQIISQVEEEVVVSGDSSSYVFSYDPPGDLLEGNELNYDGGFFDVVVDVIDPATKSTYTKTFDRSLYLYRDPYGKVKDSISGEPIVGVKITVFTEKGSIVALDKATNLTNNNPLTTDATGRFAFNLHAERKYYMVATAPGYEDYQSDVFTEQWHVIREDIKMIPAQEKMASSVE